MVIPAQDGIKNSEKRGYDGERIVFSGEEDDDDRLIFPRTSWPPKWGSQWSDRLKVEYGKLLNKWLGEKGFLSLAKAVWK